MLSEGVECSPGPHVVLGQHALYGNETLVADGFHLPDRLAARLLFGAEREPVGHLEVPLDFGFRRLGALGSSVGCAFCSLIFG